MTNKEALLEAVQTSVSDNALEKALIDGGMTGNDAYVAANEKSVDLCAIKILKSLLSTPDVSEGDYSIKYDRKAIQARLDALNAQYFPATVTGPTVKAVSVW